MCFIFHIAGHLIKLLQIITVQPLRHQLVAVRLMRNGKELLKPCQKFRAQCARRSCQQQMNCQLLERLQQAEQTLRQPDMSSFRRMEEGLTALEKGLTAPEKAGE